MSHAGQLLGESPQLGSEDRRLTQIIRTNADRVSGIINNVLSLSKREETRQERLSLQAWTEEFQEEFCDTMQRSEEHTSELQSQSNLACRLLLEKENGVGLDLLASRSGLPDARAGRHDPPYPT